MPFQVKGAEFSRRAIGDIVAGNRWFNRISWVYRSGGVYYAQYHYNVDVIGGYLFSRHWTDYQKGKEYETPLKDRGPWKMMETAGYTQFEMLCLYTDMETYLKAQEQNDREGMRQANLNVPLEVRRFLSSVSCSPALIYTPHGNKEVAGKQAFWLSP